MKIHSSLLFIGPRLLFTSFSRATSRAATKGALSLFSVAVLLAGSAALVRGQSPLDGFDPNANGAVRVVVVQPDRKILLGGDFTALSPNGGAAVTRNYIARLNPDGTLDTAVNPNANAAVRSIAVQADSKILVGGEFISVGEQARNYIARLDATTGLADSFDPNANNIVSSIAVQADGKILVGGQFNGPNRSPDLSWRLASLSTAARPAQQHTTLTLADRVAYQRAIEEVYWRHRIWPKENIGPKPSFEAVMSSAQLEKKVEDYLRNSEVLEDYWQQQLSAAQLQAEMARMAQHTKQPEVLRELFEALGNDPFVIAECLARPALSERLVTNFYAYDQRFHGKVRQRAQADLQAHSSVEQMKQTSGMYREIELVRSDNSQRDEKGDAVAGLKMSSREWEENLQKLSAMFAAAEDSSALTQLPRRGEDAPTAQIKPGLLSPLQEDEGRYYVTAVLEKSKDRLKLATVEWRKETLESWRARAENQPPTAMASASANYTLPTILETVNDCTDDTWRVTPHLPLNRHLHTAVWTGSEMIIWGGYNGSFALSDGGRYSPSTDSWTPTSVTSAPSSRQYHTAIWTGTEMIVWGGNSSAGDTDTGGRYNPSADSWTPTSITSVPLRRYLHTAVWTGTEMIVWGG
jgi:hypothetical protein